MKRRTLVLGRAGAIVATVGGTIWLALAVWRSPHRSDLATFGSYAAAIAVIAAGLITRAWSAGTSRHGGRRGGGGREPGTQLPVPLAPDFRTGGGMASAASGGAGADVSLAAPLGRRDPDRPLRGRSALLDELAGAWGQVTDAAGVQVLYGLARMWEDQHRARAGCARSAAGREQCRDMVGFRCRFQAVPGRDDRAGVQGRCDGGAGSAW
jgi:hypothetical protein